MLQKSSMSPTMIPLKKDKSIKIALKTRELNQTRVLRKKAMPNITKRSVKLPVITNVIKGLVK